MTPNVLGWLFILLICFDFICIFVAVISGIKLQNVHIKHPYIVGIFVTGNIGAVTAAIILSNADNSLEATAMAFIYSIGVIIASVVAGVMIGKLNSSKSQKTSKQDLR